MTAVSKLNDHNTRVGVGLAPMFLKFSTRPPRVNGTGWFVPIDSKQVKSSKLGHLYLLSSEFGAQYTLVVPGTNSLQGVHQLGRIECSG